MAEEVDARLWNHYAHALAAFTADPSPLNEGIVIQRYAEWAHSAHPGDAVELISLLTRHLARILGERGA
jgi:hypothetical protein